METQSQLPRHFSSRAMRGWGMATIVTFAFLLGVIFAFLLGALAVGDSAYTRARSNVTQLFRQSAWNHALGTEPAASRWPWELVMPTEGASVPRLGLSAAVLRGNGEAESNQRSTQRAISSAEIRRADEGALQ
jgi:hypothetical protein